MLILSGCSKSVLLKFTRSRGITLTINIIHLCLMSTCLLCLYFKKINATFYFIFKCSGIYTLIYTFYGTCSLLLVIQLLYIEVQKSRVFSTNNAFIISNFQWCYIYDPFSLCLSSGFNQLTALSRSTVTCRRRPLSDVSTTNCTTEHDVFREQDDCENDGLQQ